jgi:protein TonB
MRDTFPFLTRLGLRPDADTKDIRRAYARELKKVDQSADPAGFQELREAYDIALQWDRHRQFAQQDGPAAPEAPNTEEAPGQAQPAPLPPLSPPPAAPAEPEPAPDDPYQLADQAFQKFISSMNMLVQRNDGRRQTLWKSVLQRALDDERLLNLTARTIFEARIVHLLASGWKPGHETLFVVASEVFEWARDSRRILQFGEAGAMVNRAIDEWKLYESLDSLAIGNIKQLIQFVRRTPQPEGVAGRSDLLQFHQVASRFYAWLAIIVDRDILERWGSAAQAEIQRGGAGPAAPIAFEPAPAYEEKRASWEIPRSVLGVLCFIAVLRGCANLLDDDPPKGFYPPPTTQEQPAERQWPVPARANAEQPPSEERIAEIRSRIKYKWPANTPVGEYAVVYDVFIDADGAVLGMNLIESSGNKAYDAAVQQAIRETKPFPAGTKTRFSLRYGMKFSQPAPPKGTPPTKAQISAVQDLIFYVPGSAVGPGELRVEYQLELDDQGKVVKLKKLKASRDPAYDEVVADALMKTDAFPPGTQRQFSVVYTRTLGKPRDASEASE